MNNNFFMINNFFFLTICKLRRFPKKLRPSVLYTLSIVNSSNATDSNNIKCKILSYY